MREKTILAIAAMGLIAALDIIAMVVMHIDGMLLLMSATAIAGLAGYEVAKIKEIETYENNKN